MSAFIALPTAALAVAGRSGGRRLVLLELYQRADAARWGWLQWTERELVDVADGLVSRSGVASLLDGLEQAGLAEVERAAPRSGKPSRVRLVRPTRERADQDADQDADQRHPRETPTNPPRQPGREPGAEPAHARVRRPEQSTEQTTDSGLSSASARAREADPLEVAELVALQEADEPQHGLCQERDRSALERALLRGSTLAELVLVWAWSGASNDADAEAARRGNWRRWSSLLKQPQGTERIAAAQRWDAAGRPRGPPQGPGGKRRRINHLAELMADDWGRDGN